jgi:hypothetical protein
MLFWIINIHSGIFIIRKAQKKYSKRIFYVPLPGVILTTPLKIPGHREMLKSMIYEAGYLNKITPYGVTKTG